MERVPEPDAIAASSLAPLLNISPRTMRTRLNRARVLVELPRTFTLALAGVLEPWRVDGVVVACSLWFHNFSTWRGVHGIYLEDLYVQPEHRGAGLGRALLKALAAECERRGFARLEWSVLNWNEPSIGFYRALGAVAQDEWTVFRMDGPALESLGAAASDGRVRLQASTAPDA